MIPVLNIKRLERDHGKFLVAHRDAIHESAEEAKEAGLKLSKGRPGYKNRTGKTTRKTKGRVIRRKGKTIVVFSNSSKHAAVLEKGSRPHMIAARPFKMLRFKINGAVIFRKSVRHPGTKPYHFLSKGRDVASRKFEQIFRSKIARAARSF